MASSSTTLESDTRREDVLAYLPVSIATEYKTGQMIYNPEHPSNSIHLVVSGKVELSQITAKGRNLLLEIIRPNELFGESAFLDARCRSEQATAFEKSQLMKWAISEMENPVMTLPRLAA